VRILIVDDESYAADALGSLLRGRGYEATVAHDGASGIAAGVAGHLDAAVIDLGLGPVDGYEVARTLRERHGDLLRLIAYTGFAGTSVERCARANGFDCVLVKPATIDSIVAAIERKSPDGRSSTSGDVQAAKPAPPRR
jgi:DNA-binding response OmpR family regulator